MRQNSFVKRHLDTAGARALPNGGMTLSLETSALRSGLIPVHEQLQVRFRDYRGQTRDLGPNIEVLRVLDPPSATPRTPPTSEATRARARAFLPHLVMGLTCEARTTIDSILVLDRSTSMLEAMEGGNKLLAARLAAHSSIDSATSASGRQGIVVADASPVLAMPLSADVAALHAKADTLTSHASPGGSRLDLALEAGLAALQASPKDRRAILLITDGRIEAKTASRLVAASRRAGEAGLDVMVLGIGEEMDRRLFRNLAGSPAQFKTVARVDEAASIVEDMIQKWRCPAP